MLIALVESFTDKPWRSPATFSRILESLKQKWTAVAIQADDGASLKKRLSELGGGGNVFVFNIAEYLDEAKKQGFLPALLDSWGYPHLGSGAKAIALGLDKAETKVALRKAGIPTPRDFVARPGDTPGSIFSKAKEIGYPLMVKPCLEGGHIGISDDSIATDEASLSAAVSRVFNLLSQPALVETYIGGLGMREFSVGVIDTADGRIFTPIEIDYDAMDVNVKILSHDSAVRDLERVKPLAEIGLRKEMEELANRTFDAVGASDYARVDIRMDDTAAYVLEINLMPGLGPHSFLPQAARDLHGLDYPALVRKLAEASMLRKLGRSS